MSAAHQVGDGFRLKLFYFRGEPAAVRPTARIGGSQMTAVEVAQLMNNRGEFGFPRQTLAHDQLIAQGNMDLLFRFAEGSVVVLRLGPANFAGTLSAVVSH